LRATKSLREGKGKKPGEEDEDLEKKKNRNFPFVSLTHPAPDLDPFAAPHGRRCRAVELKVYFGALPRLELLRGDRDRAAAALVEDCGAVDRADKQLTVDAVAGLDL
jgi:hypothetical protein